MRIRTEEQKAKHREEQKRYVEKYPDRVKASRKKYYEKNKDKIYERRKMLEYGSNSSKNIYRRRIGAEDIENCDKKKYRRHWTYEEDEFLIDYYSSMTMLELSEHLGRTRRAIERRRNRLGIYKNDD